MAKVIQTTGDMRIFLANLALAVAHGETKPDQAAVAIKACKEINTSLYSEIKVAAIRAAAGKGSENLGDMGIGGS